MNFIHSIITIFLSLYNIGTHFFLCIAASELRASVLFSKSVRFLSCGIWYPLHVNHFCRDLSRAKENDPPCCRGSFFLRVPPRHAHAKHVQPTPTGHSRACTKLWPAGVGAHVPKAHVCAEGRDIDGCEASGDAPPTRPPDRKTENRSGATDAKHPEMRPQLAHRTEKQKTEGRDGCEASGDAPPTRPPDRKTENRSGATDAKHPEMRPIFYYTIPLSLCYNKLEFGK